MSQHLRDILQNRRNQSTSTEAAHDPVDLSCLKTFVLQDKEGVIVYQDSTSDTRINSLKNYGLASKIPVNS